MLSSRFRQSIIRGNVISKNLSSASSQSSSKDESDRRYILSMFPYPSGKLHIGHIRVYTLSDTLARYHKLRGRKVLHPIGWDSFGLPAENAAMERNISPSIWTEQNIASMKSQLLDFGFDFDWDKELSTCHPGYYRWTQWLFLQLYKHGLAYRKKALVNWDPVDHTVLADEQVDSEGRAWRSGAVVEQRYLEQWFLKISKYSEALLNGLDGVNWPYNVKKMQKWWIGRSRGLHIDFKVEGSSQTIRVFTTCPHTLYGVTYLAVASSHGIVNELLHDKDVLLEVEKLDKKKNMAKVVSKGGINTGIAAIHPLTGDKLPVFVADYVLGDHGTGAIMGVPSMCSSDKEFAIIHGLPSKAVADENKKLINSEQFSGLDIGEADKAIMDHLKSLGLADDATHYKLKDWLISRQRYWGTPIPIIYCDKCGTVPVPENDLPVLLPHNVQVSGKGLSPLLQQHDWIKASCGKPGCCAKRETDTMDTFVDSSWYFLRFIDPRNQDKFVCKQLANQWMPIDTYIGGSEHANLHLLYARFITHFLYDLGIVKMKEPFNCLIPQGLVYGKTHRMKDSGKYLKPEEVKGVTNKDLIEVTWEKMSKSKYNGVDADDIDSDVLRVYILFKAPPVININWDDEAIMGPYRFLQRTEKLVRNHICSINLSEKVDEDSDSNNSLHKFMYSTIDMVTSKLEERHKLNTTISDLMKLLSHLEKSNALGTAMLHKFLLNYICLLSPFAPKISLRLWKDLQVASRSLGMTPPTEQQWPDCESMKQEKVTEFYASDVIHQVNEENRKQNNIESII